MVSHTGNTWRNVGELQEWAVRTFADRCSLIENGATIAEDLGSNVRRTYEIIIL